LLLVGQDAYDLTGCQTGALQGGRHAETAADRHRQPLSRKSVLEVAERLLMTWKSAAEAKQNLSLTQKSVLEARQR
jgi:hypothetical protein